MPKTKGVPLSRKKIKTPVWPGYSDSILPLHWHEDPCLCVFSVSVCVGCVCDNCRVSMQACVRANKPWKIRPPAGRAEQAPSRQWPANKKKSKPSIHWQQLGKLFIGHHRLKCNIVVRVTCFYMSQTTKCLELYVYSFTYRFVRVTKYA